MSYNIDINKIALKLDFDVEDVEMLMGIFVQTANDTIDKMGIAINNNDFEEIYQTSHSLKGSAGNLTLDEISELSKTIESKSKSKDIKFDYKLNYDKLIDLIKKIEK
ncbi:MAG: Hpt domain-containing protein [Campylobacterota bacterium]|nr:Hpt domain-containing protein [Campylobacterota bacterium]